MDAPASSDRREIPGTGRLPPVPLRLDDNFAAQPLFKIPPSALRRFGSN